MWHPQAGGPRAAARRGQGHGVPRDRLRPAGREPLHQPPLLGGRRTERADALGLDGPLPRRRRQPGNPLQGLSLDYSLAPALATDEDPGRGRLLAVGLRLLGLRPRRTVDSDRRSTRSARSARSARPRPPSRRRARPRRTPRSSATRSRRSPNTKANPASPRPVTYPTSGGEFPQRLAVLAAMLDDEALPIKCVSLTAVGCYDTHSDEAETLATNLARDASNRSLAFQRDLEARGLDDRVVIQLWSEFGRRPQENGSGTDHGAAGVGVPDRQPREGRDGRRVPRPRPNSTSTKTSSTPRTSAPIYAGILGAVAADRSRARDPRRRHRASTARAPTAPSPS